MNELIKREIERLNGLFYGSLTDSEREVVDEAVERGLARREYNFLGLSKVIAV